VAYYTKISMSIGMLYRFFKVVYEIWGVEDCPGVDVRLKSLTKQADSPNIHSSQKTPAHSSDCPNATLGRRGLQAEVDNDRGAHTSQD
jgi:hypothetical protein